MRVAGLTAAVLLLAASPVVARMHAGPNVLRAGHRLAGAIALLDGGGSFASPAGAYSFRKLKSGYAGPGIKLRRASDNATQNINFLGFTGFTGAPLDVAAASAFCSATTCTMDTWYDQSGNARHIAQGFGPGQPDFVANCLGGQPCLQLSNSGMTLQSASVTPATGVQSLSAVANRNAGTTGVGRIALLNGDVNRLYTGGAANTWVWDAATGGGGSLAVAAADAAWHAFQGTLNGASSYAFLDGTATTGTLTGSAAAGVYGNIGPSVGSIREAELIIWDNYALTPAERAALTSNQRQYWGF